MDNYVMAQNSPTDFLRSFDWDEKNWISEQPAPTTDVSSIWEEMATGIQSVGSNAWDAAKGAWISTKEVVSDGYTGIKNEIVNSGGGLVDYLQNKIIILAIVLIAILYVAGKSGLFSAVVAVAK